MDRFAEYMVSRIATEKWSELDKMKMKLGFQVFFHNIWMTAVILLTAVFLGIFKEALLLMTAYGLLKINAGGIHFQTSCGCLAATGTFIVGGSFLSGYLDFPIYAIAGIYIVCIIIAWKLVPQGTPNNPIAEENQWKMKRNTVILVAGYLLITIWMSPFGMKMPYLLCIAAVFEMISLIPGKIRAWKDSKKATL